MNILWNKKIRFVAAAILMAASSLLVGNQVMSQDKKSKDMPLTKAECDYISPVKRLKIGNHIFRIPREINKSMENENGFVSYKKIACINPEDPPFELTELHISPSLSGYPKDEFREGWGFSTRVILQTLPEPHEPIDTYEFAIKKDWLNPTIDLTKLPVEEGYYVLKYKPKRFLYIPVDKEFKTPSGNPVIFGCSYYAANERNPIHCGTGVVWKDDMLLGINRISEAWVPKKDLRIFYNRILDYVENLEEKGENN